MSVKKLVVLCTFFAQVALVFSQVKPAIYFDNGLDQTSVDHLMTSSERTQMEQQLLNMLDLPKRPKRIRTSLKMSASRYLMEVYNTLAQEEKEEKEENEENEENEETEENDRVKRDLESQFEVKTNITTEEYSQIEESDIIMTFESSVATDQNTTLRHEHGNLLRFNTLEIPFAEDILGAELRLYKNSTGVTEKLHQYPEFTIHLWQVDQTDDGQTLKHISAVNTSVEYTGWIELNITSCLHTWVNTVTSNHGIYLTLSVLDKPDKKLKPKDAGIVIETENEEIKPFMVAFMKATNRVNPKIEKVAGTRTKREDFKSFISETYNREAEEIHSWRDCRVNNLYISFKELNWEDWVIAPTGFYGYYCAGRCKFPLNGHLNATNHAIVQTLVHMTNPGRYPRPCCAPRSLSSISMLFFLDDSNVVLKRYKNMMVKTCGCQ